MCVLGVLDKHPPIPPCAWISNLQLINTEARNEWGFLLLCSTVVSDIYRTAEPLHSSSIQVMKKTRCWICGFYIYARYEEIFRECYIVNPKHQNNADSEFLHRFSVMSRWLIYRNEWDLSWCHTELYAFWFAIRLDWLYTQIAVLFYSSYRHCRSTPKWHKSSFLLQLRICCWLQYNEARLLKLMECPDGRYCMRDT